MGPITKQSVQKLFLAVPFALLAAGCGAELDGQGLPEDVQPEAAVAADAPESLAQVEQGVALGGTYWWGTSNNGNTTYTIGTTTGQTCFLTGVQGNLKPTVAGNWSSAGTYMSGGNWFVYVNHNNSKALGTGVQCLATSTGRTAEVTWRQGTAAKLLGAVTADRRCFLTRLEASTGAFTTGDDEVKVWNDGLNWYLGGDLSGTGGGRAMCVDVPTGQGSWLWGSGYGGGFTENLAYNPGGVACLLTGLGGPMTTSSFTDGVSIDYNSGTRYWEMTVVNGKRGYASCVK
ncbi:hypothetical protein D7Y13_23360 [Corallococcus praedator]|uniref:Lipoprotein n=1 Tax=Corallococcus praedator TaxID=2316724 RepID=A0ABX9QDM0_9BACT|nr:MULTISPECIES: hypothetical protein [Corallococcus]RKH10371.1 hypothetical protein D7X74_27635 [Corallococcus sp. CA047B]RKH25681.1 hypothetical protein D7X75_29640 [Corallococcus sp. CA031C]RKI02938.1 hypothetical protein D7Y13_23360 [Corallococcus praedator]